MENRSIFAPSSNHKIEVEKFVEQIIADQDPAAKLQEILSTLENHAAISVQIFEIVSSQIRIDRYWIYYLISRAYLNLGRDDASFLTALSAIRMEPSYPSWHMYQNIFQFYCKNEKYKEAIELANRQIKHTPEAPIISPVELQFFANKAGITVNEDSSSGEGRTSHLLYSKEQVNLTARRRYGLGGSKTKCYPLDRLDHIDVRPEVIVWELVTPEIIVYRNNVLVYDSSGNLQEDISVCEFARALSEKVRSVDVYCNLEQKDATVALNIVDKFTTANLCHFLYDHATRINLYKNFCDIPEATVIGASVTKIYQECIVSYLNIKNYYSSDGEFIIRPKKLYISETCKKTFNHPAHLGAGWAISMLKEKFSKLTCQKSKVSRLYISRKDAAHRFIRNEAEILVVLEKYNFTTVTLSDYTYEEQVILFANAGHVVGMHGAGLTNIVFCPPGAHVLEICHPLSGSASYAAVASQLDINYSAMVGMDTDFADLSYNDPDTAIQNLGMGGLQVTSNRDVTVDVKELARWMSESEIIL